MDNFRIGDIDFKALIKEAVNAGMVRAGNGTKDALKDAEKRLYALPILRGKILDDMQRLLELKSYGLPERSKSIVRFSRSGRRLNAEEIFRAVLGDLEAVIERDKYEVEVMEKALSSLTGDKYYFSLEGKYFLNLTDDELAEKFSCDTSTVWRNRKRLLQSLAVRLYGVEAIW